MKILLISVLLSTSLWATAQQVPPPILRTRIVDDNQTLSIQLDGIKNGRRIHYNRTFDVARMNFLQKEVLKYRAFNSQGVMPPLHEVMWLILGVSGFVAGVAALLIVCSQGKKAALMSAVNG